MSLINQQYFVGKLNIPNTDNSDVLERLNLFIEKEEQRFLEALLGYSLCKSFLLGLQAVTPAQKWVDLLQGVEYTNTSGRLAKWKGIVPSANATIQIDVDNSFEVVVGRGQTYDPAAGSNTVILPPHLTGKQFIIVQRTYGQLRSDEYSIAGNVLTLNNWNFSANDTYFYNAVNLQVSTTPGSIKESIIANYVYSEWLRDQFTQSVGIGEVKTKAENSHVANPSYKIIEAWNEMAEQVVVLMDFLTVKQSEYPEWDIAHKHCALRTFWRINSFGI